MDCSDMKSTVALRRVEAVERMSGTLRRDLTVDMTRNGDPVLRPTLPDSDKQAAQAGARCKRVCMVVYTLYDGDARVRREAETLAATGLYEVDVLTLKDGKTARQYTLSGVNVRQLNARKYRGGNPARYVLSYLNFAWLAFLELTRRSIAGTVDVVHVHNMPDFLIMAAIAPILQRRTVILDLHDTMPETFAGTFPPRYRSLFLGLLGLEERICCAMADHIICVNEVQREVVVKRLPSTRAKALVSMNVPDPKRFRLS